MDKWQIWHRFNGLVKQNRANPIKCPDCSAPMITRVRDANDDAPVLWCHECDIFLKPGLDVMDRVRAVVSEHYL